MNCKPGEMAMVVRGYPTTNRGRVVTVKTIYGDFFGEVLWEYEGDLSAEHGGRCDYVGDSCLMPLRNPPGQDETLTWKPVPATPEQVPA